MVKTLLTVLAAALIACGGSPADKLMDHRDKVLTIIEDNKDDLDKAANEVGDYLAKNAESLEALEAELDRLERELAKDKAKLEQAVRELEPKAKALRARMERILKEVPKITEHEALKSALSDLID